MYGQGMVSRVSHEGLVIRGNYLGGGSQVELEALVAAHEEVVEVSHKYILAFLAGRNDRRFILGRVNRRDCCVAAVENGNGHAFIKGGIVYHEGGGVH